MCNSFDFVKATLKEMTVQIQTASDVPSCAPNTPKLAPYTHISKLKMEIIRDGKIKMKLKMISKIHIKTAILLGVFISPAHCSILFTR